MLFKDRYYFLLLAAVFFTTCDNPPQNTFTGSQAGINNYRLARNWPDLPAGFKLGNPSGIGIDTNQNIFIFHRAGRTWPLIGPMPATYISSKTILMLSNTDGKILNSWGDNLFIMPHGLTVDRNNNIWVTDVGLHQVLKFSHDGNLLMRVGSARIAGNDSTHFNMPTDVAVANDGSFYVSDGYGNSRIVKFSSMGKYLFEWGKKGAKAGEFNLPHAIAIDSEENLYVADRENSRVQVFTPMGTFLKQWAHNSFGRISSVVFDIEQKTFAAVDYSTSWFGIKHNGSDIILVDSSGNFQTKFGKDNLKKGRYKMLVSRRYY